MVIATSDILMDDGSNDEQLYRPFRNPSNIGMENGNVSLEKTATALPTSSQPHHAKLKNSSNARIKEQIYHPVGTAKPLDLLTVLLGGPARDFSGGCNNPNNDSDMVVLIEEATKKSGMARSMTIALATKQNTGVSQTNKEAKHDVKVGNEFYVATVEAHTEAALSFQKVYRRLLGLGDDGDTSGDHASQKLKDSGGLAPSEELAKSMLLLANGHARMASSLGNMGVKWNIGNPETFGLVGAKNSPNITTVLGEKDGHRSHDVGAKSNACSEARPCSTTPQHERLRMTVRGALDTANHEEDITNSTFLARSALYNTAALHTGVQLKSSEKSDVAGSVRNSANDQRTDQVNPVDDLMKLENELKCMDMALEVGNSVTSLTAAVSSRPEGSFYVVPSGTSHLSSSFMWTHGATGIVDGVNAHHAKQQKHSDRVSTMPPNGTLGVRSRSNHLQNFIEGSKPAKANYPSTLTAQASITPSPPIPNVDQLTSNSGLDQSWWGGGHGSMMASVLASSAMSTVTTSYQRSTPHPNFNQNSPRRDSTNTKQLVQLMDSLNRLGNENAQLLREVEEAKAARVEAETAMKMMEQFKKDYSQKFSKVKEALEKYSRNDADNPVNNSSYMISTLTKELQKRDETIKKLAADIRKERDENKKKDAALRKYEGFYREVKARSAEKARQRQLEEEQRKAQQQTQPRDG